MKQLSSIITSSDAVTCSSVGSSTVVGSSVGSTSGVTVVTSSVGLGSSTVVVGSGSSHVFPVLVHALNMVMVSVKHTIVAILFFIGLLLYHHMTIPVQNTAFIIYIYCVNE